MPLGRVSLRRGKPTQVRDVELTRAFYRAFAERCHRELGVRGEDLLVSLVDVKKEHWSFGLGVAQYAS